MVTFFNNYIIKLTVRRTAFIKTQRITAEPRVYWLQELYPFVAYIPTRKEYTHIIDTG